MFLDKEIPENLPEIKYIDISNEEYMRITSLFSLQPERLNPEDYRKIMIDKLNEILDEPEKSILNSMVCDSLNSENK